MADAATIALPYPEAAVVEEQRSRSRSQASARTAGTAARPRRLLLLARRGDPRPRCPARSSCGLWIDAHGDLNTPETSPSGNTWGMPLRIAIDAGAVAPADVALVGARNLDPPEVAYMQATGIDDDLDRALDGCDRVYIAFDVDVLLPGRLAVFMPEPGGPTLTEAEALLRDVTARLPLAGLGLTGLRDDADPAALVRLAAAAGL